MNSSFDLPLLLGDRARPPRATPNKPDWLFPSRLRAVGNPVRRDPGRGTGGTEGGLSTGRARRPGVASLEEARDGVDDEGRYGKRRCQLLMLGAGHGARGYSILFGPAKTMTKQAGGK